MDGTGLIYLRARYYDPTSGRFMSRDPILGSLPDPPSLNRFAYVLGNPAGLVDPGGLEASQAMEDVCADQSNPLRWFCGDSLALLNPIGVYRMNPFERDILAALDGMLGGDTTRYSTGGSGPSGASTVPAVPEGSYRIVIGKMDDLRAPGALIPGERELDLPNLGSPKPNWAQNAGKLRAEMARGVPIRDVSVDANGNLTRNTGFLRAERNLLADRGWTYDPGTTLWYPPPQK